jgi:molybdate transport system substrate-binding protein
VVFARNGLTIVTPIEGRTVNVPADLARPGVRVVAAGPGVPITRYAEAALAQLAATTPDPVAFAAAVAANVVSREDNVRAALAKVELGEADAAIVYRTDARSSGLVREVPLPAGVAVTADYAALQVSPDPAAAAFVAWLRGSEAVAILEAAGFVRAAEPDAAGPDAAEPSPRPA